MLKINASKYDQTNEKNTYIGVSDPWYLCKIIFQKYLSEIVDVRA